MVKIAINGFGRIGRCALKILLDRRDVEVVAINDHKPLAASAYLLSMIPPMAFMVAKSVMTKNQDPLGQHTQNPRLSRVRPAKLSWGKLDVDVV